MGMHTRFFCARLLHKQALGCFGGLLRSAHVRQVFAPRLESSCVVSVHDALWDALHPPVHPQQRVLLLRRGRPPVEYLAVELLAVHVPAEPHALLLQVTSLKRYPPTT